MKVSDFDFELPEELIAQSAIEPRDNSKLLIVDKKSENFEDKQFYDILDYLNEDDILVLNKTKVIPARLFGKKENGVNIECFLLKRMTYNNWEVLLKPAKKLKLGSMLYFSEELSARLLEIKEDGNRVLEFYFSGVFEEILDKIAQMPLPPYITKKLEDKKRYQTVYAKEGQSVAAPTAGLHFTNELLDKIEKKGIKIVEVFLTVGLGTFRPVKVDNIKDHIMHSEDYYIPQESADIINKAKKEGKRIVAVGTTSIRTLESSINQFGEVVAQSSSTDIFIYGDYKFKVVDALITNFHLPKSTLIMLVSSFAGKEKILNAYKYAIDNKYRFFSFGDSMFIK